MRFTDLPEDVLLWILSQHAVTDAARSQFLACHATHAAAHKALVSGRTLAVRCQPDVVRLPTHYDFGVYSVSPTDPHALPCTLRECVGGARFNAAVVLRAAALSINACLDDRATAQTLAELAVLALRLRGRAAALHLYVTVRYWNRLWTAHVLRLFEHFTSNASLATHLKLHLPSWFLPDYAAGLGHLAFDSINIQAAGTTTLDDPVLLQPHLRLRRLKLIADFHIPNLALLPRKGSALKLLELDLPLEIHTQCVREGHFAHLQTLEELRITRLLNCEYVALVFRVSDTMPHLASLYLCFDAALRDLSDFDFFTMAPGLRLMYLSDKRGTVQKKLPLHS